MGTGEIGMPKGTLTERFRIWTDFSLKIGGYFSVFAHKTVAELYKIQIAIIQMAEGWLSVQMWNIVDADRLGGLK